MKPPVRVVVPPLPPAKLLMLVKFAPLIVVVLLKFNVKLKPFPFTVDPKVGVVPVMTESPSRVSGSL